MVSARPVRAAPAPFDLSGPTLRVTVTRQGQVLPIAAVPQLAAGDRLSIAAQLPPDEAAHYLLVTAFLRDPTNPPPDKWFLKSQTWHRPGRGGGPVTLIVPDGAHHLVLFLAPATGGDFGTLRAAVQARPGAYVRAAQDLEQASLDRSRYEAYLTAIRKAAADTPDALARVAPVVAGSLRIKINDDCLQRQPEFQAACLLDAKQAVVLGNDDSSSSTTLSSAAADLALSLSETPAGGLGYYSPYILARDRRHLQRDAYRPLPVYSGARCPQRRRDGAGAEHPAVVCQPQIGADGRAAGRGRRASPGAGNVIRRPRALSRREGAVAAGGDQPAVLRHRLCA
jgi:hypothetical protein